MDNDEILEHDQPGRKSGIRRLVYRPPPDVPDGRKRRQGGKARWRDDRSWPEIKKQLQRTLRRAPEVVIIVSGSRRGHADDRAAIKGVLRYMLYISRNGRLLTVDEHGAPIDGRDAIRETHARWDLDMQRLCSARGEPLHPSFNILFSMPAKTAPDKVFDAVQAFAREHFQKHEYVMALHTPETDPGNKVPEHPHVHVIVRAEDKDGKRLYIRKSTLRAWRERFAAELRARGIDANATPRAERGISLKAHGAAEWRIDKRSEDEQRSGKEGRAISRAKLARFMEAAKELHEGSPGPKPWELAMAARRRDELRKLAQSAAALRREGDAELAEQVERFMQDMPPLDTERRQMQRALAERVRNRMQERGL
ncbi:relaxase/mobilization nuclease domain-containing protein [Massilia sp. Leaf139]|uniref:relaxase/mobilization nuclease domain-containing protein n=1 Tax=Massilia sp. Leaf139 TaxID=1736272 RepID=UPI000701E8EB|nr:hypothetical protein [Massilia sp. Leaf139]KQQ96125.1 hypothetical protein ASF77_21715 [Massilia sp. Leaf139]